jgi:hypothetical protein
MIRVLTLSLLLVAGAAFVAVDSASAFSAIRSSGLASYNHPKSDKAKDQQRQKAKMTAKKQQ